MLDENVVHPQTKCLRLQMTSSGPEEVIRTGKKLHRCLKFLKMYLSQLILLIMKFESLGLLFLLILEAYKKAKSVIEQPVDDGRLQIYNDNDSEEDLHIENKENEIASAWFI